MRAATPTSPSAAGISISDGPKRSTTNESAIVAAPATMRQPAATCRTAAHRLAIRIEQAGRRHRGLERGLECSKLADEAVARLPERHRAVVRLGGEQISSSFSSYGEEGSVVGARAIANCRWPRRRGCSSIRTTPRSASEKSPAIACSRRGDPLVRSVPAMAGGNGSGGQAACTRREVVRRWIVLLPDNEEQRQSGEPDDRRRHHPGPGQCIDVMFVALPCRRRIDDAAASERQRLLVTIRSIGLPPPRFEYGGRSPEPANCRRDACPPPAWPLARLEWRCRPCWTRSRIGARLAGSAKPVCLRRSPGEQHRERDTSVRTSASSRPFVGSARSRERRTTRATSNSRGPVPWARRSPSMLTATMSMPSVRRTGTAR